MTTHSQPYPVASLTTQLQLSFNSEIGDSYAQVLYTALSDYRLSLLKYLLTYHQEAQAGDGNYQAAANTWNEIKEIDSMLSELARMGFEQASENYWAFYRLKSEEDYKHTSHFQAQSEQDILTDYLQTFDRIIKE